MKNEKSFSLTQEERKLLRDALNCLHYKPFAVPLIHNGERCGYREPTAREYDDREKMTIAFLEKFND